MRDEILLRWPSTIEFGIGRLASLVNHVKQAKRIYWFVDEPVAKKVSPIISQIQERGIECEFTTEITPEPPISTLDSALNPVRLFNPETIIAVGGGSTIDLAKVISVLLSGKQSASDIIGIDQVVERKTQLIAIPTTAGTGSEVTPIAVLTDTEEKLKKGVVSPHLIPDVAIVDPTLTYSMPKAITASTGMDAMIHCIEAFTNKNSHPIIDTIALEGIGLIADSLELAVTEPANEQARSAMAQASLYGGFCLGPVNTAAVHAFAYPLGGEFKVPHGVANAVLLPFVMKFNLSHCVEKYSRIAHRIGVSPKGSKKEQVHRMITNIRDLSLRCGIPANLKELNVPESAISEMAKAALQVKRLLDNNPRPITLGDATAIFTNAYFGVLE